MNITLENNKQMLVPISATKLNIRFKSSLILEAKAFIEKHSHHPISYIDKDKIEVGVY